MNPPFLLADIISDLITNIFAAPVANLLIIVGLLLLIIAVVGDISGKIAPGKVGRIAAGIIGTTLLIIGLSIYLKTGQPQPISLEENTNRYGGDYRQGFDIADAKSCSQLCSKEGVCVAFTFVKPGFQAPSGRCWLKSIVASPISDSCCTSGVKK
jgi:PAN domain